VEASELRDRALERQRELAARHEVLSRLGPEPEAQRHADQLARVFDATNDLVTVLDLIDARAVRRRLRAAVALLGLVVGLALLVATGVLAAYWLIAALLVLTAAVTLWLTTRDIADAEREATG
jgi:hypothetical protein